MSTLHRQMEINMHLGNYAEKTRKIYLDTILKFEDHFGRGAFRELGRRNAFPSCSHRPEERCTP